MPDTQTWSIHEDGFYLKNPCTGHSFKNYMSNGSYGLCLDQQGTGYSVNLAPSSTQGRCYITHHGFSLASKGRYVYCYDVDNDLIWNPSYGPSKTVLDSYECYHGFSRSSFSGKKNGINCISRHFLPAAGSFELWYVSVSNEGSDVRKVHLYTQLEFLLQNTYQIAQPFYSWYTDSKYNEEHGLLEIYSRKPSERNMLGFCFSLEKPDAYDAGLYSFLGNGDAQCPEALRRSKATCTPGGGEAPIAAFQYKLSLLPGETQHIGIILGEGRENLNKAAASFSTIADIQAAWKEAEVLHNAELETQGPYMLFKSGNEDKVEQSPERLWFLKFLPNQIRQQALGMIRFEYRGYRDVAQDAMGLCHYDLKAAHDLIMDVAYMQHADGRCLRQYSTLNTDHDERDFRDLPFWLILAVDRFCKAGGASSILYEKRPYIDDDTETSLLDHIIRGLRYVLRFGSHNLLQIGVGDWNDALSNLGLCGESVWLNQIAYLCLSVLEHLVQSDEDLNQFGFSLSAMKDRLYKGVEAAWTGEWFIRGFTDSGKKVGAEERLFLLPQAWFTISGMAERDPEKANKALIAMIQHLDHPDGLLKCHPAFTEFDPFLGNISALSPGLAENYAVYNHASAFGIYALCMSGQRDAALRYLKRMLPIFKSLERTGTEPYVLVNYYNGGYYSGKAGRGGISWMTGTANWLAMIIFDFYEVLFDQSGNLIKESLV